MTRRVDFDGEAERDLDKLDPQMARRILQSLKGLELGHFWKYRVGNYRIIVSLEYEVMRILVVKFGSQREVYLSLIHPMRKGTLG